MLRIGEKLPEGLEFEAYHNREEKTIKFDELKGKWVILIFYPADFTFICPTELEEAADLYDKFKEQGAEVISVSTDKVVTHKAWHDRSDTIKKIKFPMLADPTGKLCRLFGTLIKEAGESLRGSFIIDPDQVLKMAELHDNDIGRNSHETLRRLQAAKFVRDNGGVQVCPASWKPGDKTLKPGLDLVGEI